MNLMTVGDIARKLDVDRDAVAYAIRKSRIEPVGRAGLVRLFPGNTVATIKDFMDTRQHRNQGVTGVRN